MACYKLFVVRDQSIVDDDLSAWGSHWEIITGEKNI